MRFRSPRGVRLITDDISAGDWLNDRLAPPDSSVTGVTVGTVVPDGFAAYARILHPGQMAVPYGPIDVRWSQVALERGKVIHPEVQFRALIGEDREPGGSEWGASLLPKEGSMPQHTVAELIPVLERHTSEPTECWFCVWNGYGFFREPTSQTWYSDEPAKLVGRRRRKAKRLAAEEMRELEKIPTVKILPYPDGRGAFRKYFLLRGPLSAARDLLFRRVFQSPNYWWPQDRSWCIATEIDVCSTYVAGSIELIDDLLHSSLEVLPSDRQHRFDLWGDSLNWGDRRPE